MDAPIPPDEAERLAWLATLPALASGREERFDRVVRLARQTFGVRVAGVSVVGASRQWFKSLSGLDVHEVGRGAWPCARTILSPGPLVLTGADGLQLGTGTPVHFYAGYPLGRARGGSSVGCLFLMDDRPRSLGPEELSGLADLAALVDAELGATAEDELKGRLWTSVREAEQLKGELATCALRLELFRELASRAAANDGEEALVEVALARLSAFLPRATLGWFTADAEGTVTARGLRGAMPGLLPGAGRLAPDGLVRLLGPGLTVDPPGLWPGVAHLALAGVSSRGTSSSGLLVVRHEPGPWPPALLDLVENASQQLRLVLGAVSDRARQRRATELALVASTRLTALVETEPAGILVMNEEGALVLANGAARQLFARESGQDLPLEPGTPVMEILARIRTRMVSGPDPLAVLARGQRSVGEELRFRSGRVLERDFLPLVAGGQPLGSMVILRDITGRIEQLAELKRAKDEALLASRAKSAFLATMSHEIRTPMNGVLGALAMLDGSRLDAAQQALAHTAHESAEALSAMLDDVLDASRVGEGTMHVERAPVSLSRVLRALAAQHRPLARQKGLKLVLSAGADIPERVLGDGRRLRQVLGNLVANAVKFTPSGSVTVTATHARDVLTVTVADTGPGIAPAMRERLFQPFEQADPSSTRAHGGSGMGLYLARQLTELMGGTLRLKDGPRGTTFEVQVPAPAVSRATPVPSGTPPSFDGLKVLVVDDNVVNRRIARAHLSALGCAVEEAPSGRGAVEAVAAGGLPDLVLMDCHMPEMDGFEASQQIRARHGKLPPIVALSATAAPEDLNRCKESGMDDFLAKPVRREELARTLARWVRSSPSRA